jgi:hypothetical protein
MNFGAIWSFGRATGLLWFWYGAQRANLIRPRCIGAMRSCTHVQSINQSINQSVMTTYWIFFLLWARTALFLLYLSLPLFPFHYHFYCCFVVPFPFLYYLPVSSPFSSFPLFSLLPFVPFLYHYTSPPVPFHLGLWLRDNNPSLNFIVTELFIVHCSHLLPLLNFPHPSVRFIMFFALPALHMVILPWSSTGLWHLPPPLFIYLNLLFIAIFCTDFTNVFFV